MFVREEWLKHKQQSIIGVKFKTLSFQIWDPPYHTTYKNNENVGAIFLTHLFSYSKKPHGYDELQEQLSAAT